VIVPERVFLEAVDEIEPWVARWSDIIVPESEDLLAHNRYAPIYGWMYSYEKRLKYRIEEIVGRPLGHLERLLFGADGVVSEGLSNAFVHGHSRATDRAIEVGCRVGAKGLVFGIRDTGAGFDVNCAIEGLTKGRNYFSFAGNGLRSFERYPEVMAAYSDRGRVLNLRIVAEEGG